MQWDQGPQAGFTTGRPWLKIPPSANQRNVGNQSGDPSSILNFYKQLIRFRRDSPALLDGDYTSIGDDHYVYAYRRRTPAQTLLVALNMSNANRSLQLRSEMAGASGLRVAISTRPSSVNQIVKEELNLAPFEAVVLEFQTK
jgi:glycosidase